MKRLTWAIINAATKEQKECNLYIDRYQISTTLLETNVAHNDNNHGFFAVETILDTYTGKVVSRKLVSITNYYDLY